MLLVITITGIAEIYPAPLCIGQMAIVEYLQQDIKYFRMSLLNLIQQNYAV